MCDKTSFREPEKNLVKQAGELYLEYLERKRCKGTGELPARDIDYVF